MIQHLTRITSSVGETVRSWSEFENSDANYFTSGEDEKMHLYIQSIGKTASRIRQRLACLEELRENLRDGNRYTVRRWDSRPSERSVINLYIT